MLETFSEQGNAMHRRLRGKAGFTLIEILIVIIVLGILAMIIVPQISVSTDDAKVSTLQSDLSSLRSSVEIYYAQHGNKYPGEVDDTDGAGAPADAAAAAVAFTKQLTQYTNANGKASVDKDTANYPYGPYIKGGELPQNPFGTTAAPRGVTVDITTTDITTRTSDGSPTTGWKFYAITGVFIANDSVAHAAY